MKTIRTQCFETNSSSTHSITVQTKKASESRPLIINHVLMPANLRYTNAYHRSYDGHSLHAGTAAEKISLLLHHLISEKTAWDANESMINECIEAVVLLAKNSDSSLPFNEISFEGMDEADFINDCDGNLTYANEILNNSDPRSAVKDFFNDVILDDSKVIVDEDSPY